MQTGDRANVGNPRLRRIGPGEHETAEASTGFDAEIVGPLEPEMKNDLLQHKNPVGPTTFAGPAGRLDKPSTYAELDRLKDLLVDWNGYGAQPIEVELIEQAKWVVGQLPDDVVDAPAVVPMTRGRLQLEWHRGNRSLELEFESRGRIHYLKADDDSGIEEEDVLNTAQTPEIEKLLRWFSSE